MIYILTMLIYRLRGGFLEVYAPKILQHFRTFGMIGLCYVMYVMYGKFDYRLLICQILFWFALAGIDWIANFDPYTKKPRYDNWYDKYILIGYDKLGTVKTNLIGLAIKGLLISLPLIPVISIYSLHNIITLPLMYYIGWTIDKKRNTCYNYAEWLYGLVIFIG